MDRKLRSLFQERDLRIWLIDINIFLVFGKLYGEVSSFIVLLTNFNTVSFRIENAHEVWGRVDVFSVHRILAGFGLVYWAHLEEGLLALLLFKHYGFQYVPEFVEHAKEHLGVHRIFNVGYRDQKNRGRIIIGPKLIILNLLSPWWGDHHVPVPNLHNIQTLFIVDGFIPQIRSPFLALLCQKCEGIGGTLNVFELYKRMILLKENQHLFDLAKLLECCDQLSVWRVRR